MGGGLAFAASLLYFAYAYARRFGTVSDPSAPVAAPIVIDVLLFAAFAAHHSVFARSGLKARLVAVVPASLERPMYVWIASVLFFLLTFYWQPIDLTLWRVGAPLSWLLRAIQIGGGLLAIAAGRLVDVLDLSGVREALGRPARQTPAPIDRGPYAFVRHPLYLAWLLAVWPVPVMTGTRFLFALLSTIYLLMAIPLEERDLRKGFGVAYQRYAERVRSRLVPGVF
jgi:protein-S-isoprenylcysteine O-methyltransferase Ste14